jgi:antitoxin (DNA-binding transcriptional repressor) of toxin-antitoxin stability system
MVGVKMTASQLRADIYRLLDQVLERGEPIEIERHGQTLRISAVEPQSRRARLIARPDVITGDPDDLVHLDWSSEWRP